MKHLTLAATVTLLALAQPAMAISPLPAKQLTEWCKTDASETSACVGFIRGYLAGVFAADDTQNESARSDFQERATKTRIGKTKFGNNRAINFCLPESIKSSDLAKALIASAETAKGEAKSGSALLSYSLRTHYPCK